MAVASRLLLVVLLVALGAAVKTLGALGSGSRALLVDSLTCFASLAGLAAVLYYLRLGSMPPDEDHPYGHARLRYGGVVASLSAYMFAAGAGTAAVALGSEGYRVEASAVPAALAGAGFYAAAILVARGLDPVLLVYAGFTASELVESAVSAVGGFLGSRLGYVYDLAGAAIILAYVFYEAVEAHRYLMDMVSDRAPLELVAVFQREARLRGLRPVRVRLRMLDERSCTGDAVVEPPRGMGPDIADLLVGELEDEMRRRRSCDVTIRVRYARRGG